MIGANSLEVLLIKAASEGAPVLTGGTVLFEGASIADGRIGSILLGPFGVAVRFQTQEGSVWAGIGILVGVILELTLSVERGALVKVGQGHIGTNALVFKRHDILDGSIGRVSCRLAWPQFPAEACTPDEIEHRLVFHDFR